MGVTYFEIIFDRPSGSYYPGTNVKGTVMLSLDEQIKVQGVAIEFKGVAKTSWSETVTEEQNDGSSTTKDVNFNCKEKYFNNKFYLVGGSNSKINIPPGTHNYSFSSILPPSLPSSFESDHGKILYTVRVTLDRPWVNDNQHVEKVFIVVNPVDLNYNAKAKMPVELELEKTFCCFWCASGPLTLAISLPYSGYVPGQNIPITLEIDNASNVKVDYVVVTLEKVLVWRSHDPKLSEKAKNVEIVRLTMNSIEPGGSKCYTQDLCIPTIQVYNLDQCSIIKCSYVLTVTAVVSGCHSNLGGNIPIFLGTVPIYQTTAPYPPGNPSFKPTAPPL